MADGVSLPAHNPASAAPKCAEHPLRVTAQGTVLLFRTATGASRLEHALACIAEAGPFDATLALYRVTDSALWQGIDLGAVLRPEDVIRLLEQGSGQPVPEPLVQRIRDAFARKTALRLVCDATGGLWLSRTRSDVDLRSLVGSPQLRDLVEASATVDRVAVRADRVAELRLGLLALGYPLRDLVPSPRESRPLLTLAGGTALRSYQREAVDAVMKQPGGGVVVLPCGAGKSWVGLGAMARTPGPCLVVVPHRAALMQWRRLLRKSTNLPDRCILEYGMPRGREGYGRDGAAVPEDACVLITYAMLTAQRRGARVHLAHLNRTVWGLCIFDEVHVLPAAVFRLAASLTAQRRLGLSATLVREDGRQGDVVALVGPVVYAAPATALERAGFLASAVWVAVRVPFPPIMTDTYARATMRERLRLAATNPAKDSVAEALVGRHVTRGDRILVLGQYLDQIARLGARLSAPVVTGRTPAEEREERFEAFRAGRLPVLVMSRVANLALDLPGATVAIQVSGTFGSRQEEAQRLGRLLRPNRDGRRAVFYSLVTEHSPEERFSAHRAAYLRSLGYPVHVSSANTVLQREA